MKATNPLKDQLAYWQRSNCLVVVNHLCKILKNVWSDAEKRPAALHIQLSSYQDGSLKEMTAENCSTMWKHCKNLLKLNLVVKACFGFALEPAYANKIEAFNRSFLSIPNANVTLKVHSVFHIREFISRRRLPLVLYSEQAIETIHQDLPSALVMVQERQN